MAQEESPRMNKDFLVKEICRLVETGDHDEDGLQQIYDVVRQIATGAGQTLQQIDPLWVKYLFTGWWVHICLSGSENENSSKGWSQKN